jgi:M6 family metalloprotease-like protein
MNMKIKTARYHLFCVILALLTVTLILPELTVAVQAPLTPRTMTQADGSTFKVILRGDERYLHIETLDGYTILHDKDSNNWQYAIPTDDGDLNPSGLVVGKDDPEDLDIRKHLKRSPLKIEEIKRSRLKNPLKPIRHATVGLQRSENGLEEDAQLASPITGTGKQLVILTDFAPGNQTAHVYLKSQFEDMLYTDGTYSTGSLNDYYQEVSYGVYSVSGTVIDWTTAPQTYSYYCDGQKGLGTYPKNSQGLVRDMVTKIDSQVDFSQYDTDGDGKVDCVTIVFEGKASGSSNEFWPHAWALNTYAITLDGVTIYRFNINNEQTDTGNMEPVGVFCHEYGHVLGAPDMYDYDSGDYKVWDDDNRPVRYWCLMAAGNYGYSSTGVRKAGPTHMSGFIRNYYMGWITPTTITSDGTYSVNDIGTNSSGSLYKIPINGSSKEYFLIENRYPGSSAQFDKKDGYNGNALDSGLIIMHIDESMPDGSGRFNEGSPKNSYYGAWVEDPGQPSDLTQSPYLLKLDAAFSQGDSQTEFGPSTTPYNSNANAGGSSGISITNIGSSGSTVTMDVALGSAPGSSTTTTTGGSSTTTTSGSSTTTTTVSTNVNLKPAAPSGWSGPIVPSSSTGTNTVGTLCGNRTTYIDVSVKNEGPSDVTLFI